MESTILEFIRIFQSPSSIELFTECACFWFASILSDRFPSSIIMYNPESVHFATLISGNLYDITGKIEDIEGYVDWSYYEEDDLGSIIANCINIV